MGTQLPSPKGGGAPQFSAHVYCSQMVGWIKMTLGMEMGFSPGHIVLDGDQLHPPTKRAYPQFLAYLYCGQTAVYIRIPLGTEVGLNLGDIEDPSPLP